MQNAECKMQNYIFYSNALNKLINVMIAKYKAPIPPIAIIILEMIFSPKT